MPLRISLPPTTRLEVRNRYAALSVDLELTEASPPPPTQHFHAEPDSAPQECEPLDDALTFVGHLIECKVCPRREDDGSRRWFWDSERALDHIAIDLCHREVEALHEKVWA